jgi:dCMP deaminase
VAATRSGRTERARSRLDDSRDAEGGAVGGRRDPGRHRAGGGGSPGSLGRSTPAPFVVPLAMRERASWNEYFMNIAREVSTRSTCDRKFVGALIVRDKSILATGYNGSLRGLAHCDDDGHLMEDGHCVRTVHAEANAIVQAARHGVRIEGASMYVTASPCWGCFRLIANAGIVRVHFGEFYRDPRIFDFSKQLGIELVDMSATLKPRMTSGGSQPQ